MGIAIGCPVNVAAHLRAQQENKVNTNLNVAQGQPQLALFDDAIGVIERAVNNGRLLMSVCSSIYMCDASFAQIYIDSLPNDH